MAAVDELKNRLLLLESTNIDRQRQRVAGLEAEAKALRAAANSSNFRLPDQIDEFKAARARATAAEKELEVAEADLSSLELEASNLRTQIAQAERADANTPTASAGQAVDNAQRSNDDRADPVSPYPADPTTATTSNAPTTANQFLPGEDEDTGTNAELRRIEATQSVPPPTAQPVASPAGGSPGTTGTTANPNTGQPNQFLSGSQEDAAATPTTQRGAGAPSDDSGAGQNPVVAALQQLYGGDSETIEPSPNILDKCASYTYNISIYMISPRQYQQLITTKKKNLAGFSLLLQSAGAGAGVPQDPQEVQQTADGNAPLPGGRNANFPFDYYIDELQIKTLVMGKGTMSAHSATEMSFRVLEPNGITFIQNLVRATAEMASNTGTNQNAYLSQLYLMVIKFYGYDENGMPVVPEQEISALQSDKTAITEKFIPFVFRNLTFKIQGKVTEYSCSCVPPHMLVALGQQRGVIPYNIQLTSSTLKGLLTEDLPNALNGYQDQLVEKGIFIYPDKYSVKLLPPLDLDTVKVTPPGDTNFASTGMSPRPTDDPKSLNGKTQTVKADTKSNSAFSGMSIVQFIDQMVRSSDYIYQQAIFVRNPKTDELEPQTGGGKLMAWYRVSVQSDPQPDKWDPKRGDYAYNITYQVAPYLVTDTLSDYFPQSPRWTPPKEYKYWFTGENNAVLDYTQEFNALYYFTVNTQQSRVSKSPLKNASKKGYQPNSNQSSQGNRGKVNEGAANAADYLYSPTDLARIKFTIIGDPDWIEQGDVWSGVSGDKFDPAIRLPDGTINYESRETLFDMVFRTPADYDLQTGLIGPGPVVGQGEPKVEELRTRYKTTVVNNTFARGKFTQEIQGIMVIPKVVVGNSAEGEQQQPDTSVNAADSNQSEAETRRLNNTKAIGPDQSDAETRRLNSVPATNNGISTANSNAAKFADRQQDAAEKMKAARAAQYPSLRNLTTNPPTSGSQTVGVPAVQEEGFATPTPPQKGKGDD